MELPRNKALRGGYKKTPESKKEIVTNASLLLCYNRPYSHHFALIGFFLFIRDYHSIIKTRMNEIITIGCKIAATIKTPATKQKKTVVTEQNRDSIPSFNSPIRTTSITRL